MQLCNEDDMGLSQSSVSRAIASTPQSLTRQEIVGRFIKFPMQPEQIRRNQEQFYQIAGFPGIVGAVDGTHVQIIAPKDNANEYVNRHYYHSINVQVVFNANYRIIDIVAKWPSSTHDSRILNESGLRQLFENHLIPVQTHLLGDSGYASHRWLLTPFLRPELGPQTNYNRAHRRTRSLVERGIGQLKRRFYVLHGEIRMSPRKTCQVITACAVLHNVCKDRHIPLPEEEDNLVENIDDNDAVDNQNVINHGAAAHQNGTLYRRQFANTHF
ncbi:hypothetical protein ScPMuIL_002856 [Solemya velum]